MKTFFVTAAVIFVSCTSAFAEDLRYDYVCGTGMNVDAASTIEIASRNLMRKVGEQTAKLKDKFEVVNVAVTSASYNDKAHVGVLCATITKKTKTVDRASDDLAYGFPCGIGFDLGIESSMRLAAGNLTKTTDAYLKLLQKDFDVVSASATVSSYDDAGNTAIMCSTVAAKEKSKEVSMGAFGSGVR